jgi:hypothetical protein
MQRLIQVMAVCFVISAKGQEGTHPVQKVATTPYISRKWGFQIDPPPGWQVTALADTDLPMFVNFPLSELSPGLVLPKRGAMIHIVAEQDLPGQNRNYTLEDWAEFDERHAVPETISSSEIKMPASSAVRRALKVAFTERTYTSSEQQQEHVIIYWEFREKRFATYLDYIAGDRKAKIYGEVVVKAMRTVRPL